MKKVFYLVRHGDLNNPEKLLTCRMEPPFIELDENGRAQMAKAADFLFNKDIDRIYYSPLLRTKQSAAIINEKLKIRSFFEDRRLIEVDLGFLHGHPQEDLLQGTRYKKDPFDYGYESVLHAGERVLELIDELIGSSSENFVLVSHRDVILGTIMKMENKTKQEDFFSLDIKRGEIYRAIFGGKWKVEKVFSRIK